MRGKRIMIRALVAVLFLWGSVWAVSAQENTWSQEQVTMLASQMAEKVKAMRLATRKEPQVISAGSVTKQRATKIYLQTLQKLDQAAAKLSRQLAAGDGRSQTLGTARRIDMLLRDVRQQGAALYSTEWTGVHLDPALSLAAQLRSFYGVAPEPDSGSPASSD